MININNVKSGLIDDKYSLFFICVKLSSCIIITLAIENLTSTYDMSSGELRYNSDFIGEDVIECKGEFRSMDDSGDDDCVGSTSAKIDSSPDDDIDIL